MLDRCGRHFGLVLNFLRDGSVHLPDAPRELEEVLKEAQYYRVQGLVQHCLATMQVLFRFICLVLQWNWVFFIHTLIIIRIHVLNKMLYVTIPQSTSKDLSVFFVISVLFVFSLIY